jgi:hypothetical protein
MEKSEHDNPQGMRDLPHVPQVVRERPGTWLAGGVQVLEA